MMSNVGNFHKAVKALKKYVELVRDAAEAIRSVGGRSPTAIAKRLVHWTPAA